MGVGCRFAHQFEVALDVIRASNHHPPVTGVHERMITSFIDGATYAKPVPL
jgi:hypothetical protein